MKWLAISAITLLCACEVQTQNPSGGAVTAASCRGVYYTRDSNGDLHKFNQYWLVSANACLTDNVPLSKWEMTSEKWRKNNVQCTPQPQFASRTLISANNYYSYRDNKVYLDLDSSTGVYRRIILAENTNGKPVFTRLQGCFYQRTGSSVDAGFGNQLLLDTDSAKLVTSESFDAWEIFRYDETATTLNMTRFDDSGDWDFKFCPYLNTPWEYCTLLRDGNMMYWPTTLTSTQQSDLLNEALLIRKQFNYNAISKSTFENMWGNVDKTRTELGRDDHKYAVIVVVDTPWYIDQAWRDYVMWNRPTMPNVNSNRMPSICYPGSQTITLSNGNTGRVSGEVCYSNGIYTFTQQ